MESIFFPFLPGGFGLGAVSWSPPWSDRSVSPDSPTRKIGSVSSSGISRPQCLHPADGCVCTVPHAGHIHGSFIIRRLLHRLLPATTNSCRGGHRRSRSAITGAARQAFVQGSCVSPISR